MKAKYSDAYSTTLSLGKYWLANELMIIMIMNDEVIQVVTAH